MEYREFLAVEPKESSCAEYCSWLQSRLSGGVLTMEYKARPAGCTCPGDEDVIISGEKDIIGATPVKMPTKKEEFPVGMILLIGLGALLLLRN